MCLVFHLFLLILLLLLSGQLYLQQKTKPSPILDDGFGGPCHTRTSPPLLPFPNTHAAIHTTEAERPQSRHKRPRFINSTPPNCPKFGQNSVSLLVRSSPRVEYRPSPLSRAGDAVDVHLHRHRLAACRPGSCHRLE